MTSKEQAKAWYHRNKEHALSKMRERYKNNTTNVLKVKNQWRKNNPDKMRRMRDKTRFNVNTEQSDILEWNRINGKCYCCGKNSIEGGLSTRGGIKKLCVDHDHDTGKIRGLLCSKCNSFEGYFQLQLKLNKISLEGWWKDYLENPPGILGIN